MTLSSVYLRNVVLCQYKSMLLGYQRSSDDLLCVPQKKESHVCFNIEVNKC